MTDARRRRGIASSHWASTGWSRRTPTTPPCCWADALVGRALPAGFCMDEQERRAVPALRSCAAAALLARQATWSDRHGDRRPAAARHRFVALGLDRLVAPHADNTALLLG